MSDIKLNTHEWNGMQVELYKIYDDRRLTPFMTQEDFDKKWNLKKEYAGDTFGAPQPDFDTYEPSGTTGFQGTKIDKKGYNPEGLTEKEKELEEVCWKGYKQIGMKEKDGKMVPNCVPIDESEDTPVGDDELEDGDFCPACMAKYMLEAKKAGYLEEAEYQGHKVQLGKPMQGDVKKFKVYVKDPSTGNVKKVNFGDPNMRIKKSNPERRRSFRARHHCENPGPRTKARYWSCRKW